MSRYGILKGLFPENSTYMRQQVQRERCGEDGSDDDGGYYEVEALGVVVAGNE